MESLSIIIVFVQAAERLSFVDAGRALGISASAVGKAIAKFEGAMGVRLFHRTTRRVSLTHEGEMFYERCRRILNDLRDAEAMLADATQVPRGRLRISVPTIGYRFVVPAIPDFCRRYPEIELDLDCNDRLVDVVEEGFDAVIRSGALIDSGLVARRLGTFRFVMCAAPSYLDRHGIPQTKGDLARHDCLRFRFPHSGKYQAWPILDGDAVEPHRRPSPLTCNNMEGLLAGAIAGLGIAYMPDFLARDALAAGTLRTVLDSSGGEPEAFSILWPSSRLMSPRLRVFVDHMASALFRQN